MFADMKCVYMYMYQDVCAWSNARTCVCMRTSPPLTLTLPYTPHSHTRAVTTTTRNVRWLGSISIPFTTVYLNTMVEGRFQVNIPFFLLGKSVCVCVDV
jgi:hypothetical protein